MTPEKLANKYTDFLLKNYSGDIYHFSKLTANIPEPKDLEHLARTAIWLSAVENPTRPTKQILRLSSKLYTQWLREDYSLVIKERDFYRRAQSLNEEHLRILDGNRQPHTDKQVETESELYQLFDVLITELGVPLGVWAILILSSEDNKITESYTRLQIKPTLGQRRMAHVLLKKLNVILPSIKNNIIGTL